MDLILTQALSRREKLAVHGSSFNMPVVGITAVAGVAQAADTLDDAKFRDGLDYVISTWPPRRRAVHEEVSSNDAEASR